MPEADLPPDLAAFRESYAALFGSVPPLPTAKFAFSGTIDPEALRLSEQARAHAFYSDVFDVKITNLLIFGMLLAQESLAAEFHALAARRAGASWQELHKTAELASVVQSLGPLNSGAAVLKKIQNTEQDT